MVDRSHTRHRLATMIIHSATICDGNRSEHLGLTFHLDLLTGDSAFFPSQEMISPICSVPGICKICGASAPLFGVVDFNKICDKENPLRLPLSGIPIYYRRCVACGFIFSDMFDSWSHQDFTDNIYNAEYIKFDPDYANFRPRTNAETIIRMFRNTRAEISCLDYGGGNGQLAAHLRDAGFRKAETFDQFNPEYQSFPPGQFNLVTCFEVFEHVTEPKHLVESLVGIVEKGGLILFTTLLQPANIEQSGVAWWYIGPRNGHLSIFSTKSLVLLFERLGFRFGSINDVLHVAFRDLPSFASNTLKIAPQ